MAEKSKVQAHDINVQVFNKPATVRNGSGAYVSSIQVVNSNGAMQPAKVTMKKVAKAKPAAAKKASRKVVAAAVTKKAKV